MNNHTGEHGWRLGVVSFLNARPLIEGLAADRAISMIEAVPSRLPGLLEDGAVDAALVPVIDIARPGRRWKVVSDACIGSDGETLTVRIFSRERPESIRRLKVDGDSHTSVVLAKVLWRELYGLELEVEPIESGSLPGDCEAVLLIGDKVVTGRPRHLEIETDLGSVWKSLTSLPFVFAVWAAPLEMEVSDLAPRLSRARDLGVASAAMIAEDIGPGMGWPAELAKRYLTRRIKFTLGPRERKGMAKFFELASRYDLATASEGMVFA